MKLRNKILLSVIAAGLFVFIGATVFLLRFSPGGMSSTYPAKDNDPKLLAYARNAAPIIKEIESIKNRTGRLPEKLDDVAAPPKIAYVYCMTESNSYTLTIKLGWDPSLVFSSQDRSWAFDPGDGSPERKIRLDDELP
jgi:hypothetical protein